MTENNINEKLLKDPSAWGFLSDAIKQVFSGWTLAACNEDAVFLKHDSPIPEEISFMRQQDAIIAILGTSFEKQELTDGGLRIMNRMNAKRYFAVHLYLQDACVYQTRCVFPFSYIREDPEKCLKYLLNEHKICMIQLKMELS